MFYVLTFLLLGIDVTMGQLLTEQITECYDKLNKPDYCKNLISAYINDRKELYSKDPFDNPRNLNHSDSLSLAHSIEYFINMVNQPNPYFVLKMDIVNNQFAIDTSSFKFDLYWFGKPYGSKGKGVTIGLLPGPIAHVNDYCFYTAFSKVMPRRAVKAMRKILKKDPYCILACYEIWALPYLLDGKLYIYDLVSMKEYEADYYLQNIYKQ